MYNDTIVAIATALGAGGIGIVRISGPDVRLIVSQIFRPRYAGTPDTWASHTLHLGGVIRPSDGQVIDEILLAWMKGPRTYTTEDVAEFHCHGGSVAVREVMALVLACGARPAEPGEFTRRAFLGGRLDLAQAEAVLDVINAKTKDGLAVAVGQLRGKLSERITALRARLLPIMAHLEAMIDFPEEDLPDLDIAQTITELAAVRKELVELIRRADTGQVLREGWKTVIAGLPNVGKSSLLNALLNEQRAIVTDIPGTTRDAIEEFIDLQGIPLRLVDTAGLRETDDPIEQIGVEKTQQYLANSDLVLLVLDASRPLLPEERSLIESFGERPMVVLLNKFDLVDHYDDEQRLRDLVPQADIVPLSARTGWGLDQLAEVLRRRVFALNEDTAMVERDLWITRLRHRDSLVKAQDFLAQAERDFRQGTAPDFITIDLRGAWEVLGEITGETASTDLLDQIFASFCIGK
ncbi:tRNA uridine-5-carboxymethylaminomethyl(34) synthesis GTPase MnmE [Heliophilum fasciatum]|uniref:tRNA modification GTPase MnmE n=1 Tax=Heliophilum fasciatum TaxID=35700 RepID=A0A4R2RVD9_9FIRM|nr:tRNA uridine-5-carboxymethylaminomethyl(34) synthesis GTPase MnmE [Heliophilum fasciatum]MCW2278277.1 tRNA modification GTPase [Heliophilum fasciatum]TCP63901.1 tRNA modification GTPase [Heliophilum fasciatum]